MTTADAQGGGELVPFPLKATPKPDSGSELGTIRAALERHAGTLPGHGQLKECIKWWCTEGLKHVGVLALKAPYLILAEIKPICIGIGRVSTAWARWRFATTYIEHASQGDSGELAKYAKDIEAKRSARLKISIGVGVVLVGVAWWAVVKHPDYVLATSLGLVVVFDCVGRAGREKSESPIAFKPSRISEGMPLSSLRASIKELLIDSLGFDEQHTEVGQPMPERHGWRVPYQARQSIEDSHLRDLERALQVRPGGMLPIKDRENSSLGELIISLRDPLEEQVTPPDDIEPLSIFDMLPLGKSAGGDVWCESFLRTHFLMAGKSQAGKSSLFWWIIDVLRRCREVELDGIDLTHGPAFSAPWRAFRKRAFTEEDAHTILDEGIVLAKKRIAKLSKLAEADDTPDGFDEKHRPTPQEPQRVILCDEAAMTTSNKELSPKLEWLLRYGAKGAVVVGMAAQGGGLDDLGTQIIRGMAMMRILFACTRQAVLDIFGKDARDSGFRPDLLKPYQGDNLPHDAGKCFVQSAIQQDPEMRRAYRLEQSDVRRRDREIGFRPNYGTAPGEVEEPIDAHEVPPMLAAAEKVFADAGNPEWLPTQHLLPALQEMGFGDLTEIGLRAGLGLGNEAKDRRRINGQGNPVSGYLLAPIQKALG